ncbi:thiamine pyrophosphate-dependent enzyme [Acuticoccus sp.]|uniref:thiamine pyrophosphate-dependent enzyme n=1 Tax=Acuticoccus sp. TaxID=1904378 RepID=UPI003B523A1D
MPLANALDRRAAVAALLKDRDGTVVVSGLGNATYDVAAAGDDARNVYLWGAMGGTAMMGLGLALARPDVPVVVMTGDGDMLMGLGSFATIALQAPANLSIVVLDNGLFGETGAQETHTAHGTDLAAVAAACGIPETTTVIADDGLAALAGRLHGTTGGPRVAVVKVAPSDKPRAMALRDAAHGRARTRLALGLPAE